MKEVREGRVLTVLSDDVELRAVFARDTVPRTFVTLVTVRRNLVEVVKRSVGVEGINVN